ncbi:NTF2 fold immunity protein [Pseudomonas sp. JH-2]|uniref:NTF2 fold immunity protein n=1 Tax=Pseudomonas sp. JH-2 TaxID=3114998 RepID=UPI002E27154E|nr:NTF2 fold immunity protein [Pseudomonas sp. JH-2]
MDKTNEARARIKEVMDAMKLWESEYHTEKTKLILNGDETENLDNKARHKLNEILEKYVIQEGKNYGRLIDLGTGDPTTYDFDTDQVINIENSKRNIVYTHTRSAGFKNQYRITMQETPEGWKVKKRELLNHKEKWTAVPI